MAVKRVLGMRGLSVVLALVLVLTGLVVMPVPAAAVGEPVLDQHLEPDLECSSASYTQGVERFSDDPASRPRQSFAPALNRISAIALCVDPGDQGVPVTVNLLTTNGLGESRVIATATGAASSVDASPQYVTAVFAAPILTTPGVSYEIETPAVGYKWLGTCSPVLDCAPSDPDRYASGAPTQSSGAVGDFGFRTYADPVAEVSLHQSDFEASAPATVVEETFDHRPMGEVITNQIPGVTFRSSGEPLIVQQGELFGGFNGPDGLQDFIAEFQSPTASVGFWIGAQDPAVPGPATVEVTRTDESVTTFHLYDNDNEEVTPHYFGYTSAASDIIRVRVVSPPELDFAGGEEIVLDDFAFSRDLPRDIAFDRNLPNDREIHVMDADGGRPTRLTFNTAADEFHSLDSDPHFSPDGTQIAFVSARSGELDIWVMDADGTDPRNLTADIGGDAADPAWSPTIAGTSRIAFTSNNTAWTAQCPDADVFICNDIWAMNPDGSGKVNLTGQYDVDIPVRDGFPNWSPDGLRLAFVRGNEFDGQARLHTIEAPDGALLAQLTGRTTGNEFAPAWSPGGTTVVYTAQPGVNTAWDLWNVDIDAPLSASQIAPTSLDEETPAWSPDGETIVYAENTTDAFGNPLKRLVSRDLSAGGQVVLTSGAVDRAPNWSQAATSLVTELSLTVDRASAQAGLQDVSLYDIPAAQLPLIASGVKAAPVGSIPVGSIPVGSIPVGSIPVGSIDLQASPVGSIPVGSIFIEGLPVGSIPVGSIPVGSIPVGSIPVGSIGLDGTLLSSLGLSEPTLAFLMAPDENGVAPAIAGLQLQTLTLGDLLADPIAGPRYASLPVEESGLGGALFGTVGLASMLLGAVPMAEVPVPVELGGPNTDWCSLLAAIDPSFSCTASGIDPAQHSFAGASLAAAPVGSIPVGSIPVGSIPVGSIPVGSIPVGSIDLQASPVGSIPVGSIAVQGSPVGSIPVGSIPVGSIPVGSIPVGSIAVQGSPVGSIPVGSIAVEGSPVGSIPVGSIAVQGTPVGSIPVGSIDLMASPVGSIPVGSIPVGSIASVLSCDPSGSTSDTTDDCATTVTTLAEAFAAGYVLSTAQLHHLLGALSGVELFEIAAALTSAQVELWAVVSGLGDVTLAGLGDVALAQVLLWMIAPELAQHSVTLADLGSGADGLYLGDIPQAHWGDVTLFDVLIAILVQSDFPWEELPIDGLQDIAPIAGNVVTYTASATVVCPAGETASIALDLGEFRPAGGASAIIGAFPMKLGAPAREADGFLVWNIGWNACTGAPVDVSLSVNAHPALRLGTHRSSVEVTAGAATGSLADQAPVTVVENAEPDVGEPRAATVDTLLVGHLSGPGDIDTMTVPMPAKGSRVRVFLSHIAPEADFDLTIGMPSPDALQSTPVGSIPVGSIAMEDDGRAVDGASGGLPGETLQDIPVGSIPVGSISANRGDETEVAQVIADGGTAPITIQVSGYNGSWSDHPYVVRVKVYAPVEVTCVARPSLQGTPGTLPAVADAAGKRSLFLVNTERLRALYPTEAGAPDRVTQLLSDLEALAARSEIAGLVVPVEGDTDVRTAFSQWDADPCSVDQANAVVREINDVVTTYRDAPNADLQNVVMIGTDEAVPFARVPDLVTLSNEQDNTSDLASTLDANGNANALYAATALGYILTDDAYTSFTEVPWLNRTLELPQVAVSRLVETPEDVRGQIAEYVAKGGLLDSDTATTFTTGYDFLTDGSLAVAEGVESALTDASGADPASTRMQRLISESWAKADLTNVLLDPATAAPTIGSINAHFSHRAAQPAGPAGGSGAGFTRTDLVLTGDVPAPGVDANGDFEAHLLGRLLFTMGCHGGLNVADTSVPAGADGSDWAQTFAAQRAAVYLANTGYGYGDTVANALSERLMTIFAGSLGDPSTTIGQKVVLAKHAYFNTMGTYGVFDEKALIEATLYGLPFWRVGTPTSVAGTAPPAPAASGLVPAADAVAGPGIESATITLAPLAGPAPLVTQQTHASRGTYWAGPDGAVSFAPYRPLQPLVTQNVTVPGKTARGVIIKDLATTDVVDVGDFARALPTIDHSANEPEPDGAGDIYPANMVRLATSAPFGGLDQKLLLIAGQSRADATGNGGVERLVSAFQADVLYSSGAASEPPTIEELSAEYTPDADPTTTAGSIEFRIKVAAGSPTAQRAAVLFKAGTESGQWDYRELTYDSILGVWKTTATVSAPEVEILGQVQGAGAAVAYTTNKGSYFNASLNDVDPPVVSVVAPVDGAIVPTGTALTATYACTDPSGILVCEGSVPSGTALDTSTPGSRAFTVTAIDQAGNRTTTTVNFLVAGDGTPPAITVSVPADGAYYRQGAAIPSAFSCTDDSGSTTCEGPVGPGEPFDTSTPGAKQFTVTATDGSGNEASRSITYHVDGTGPEIVVSSPGPRTYLLGEEAVADYECTDAGSGLATCVGDVADGGALDTSTVGERTFTVTATDTVGNVTTHQVTYTVVYDFDGFFAPISMASINKVKAGSTVPAKFSARDAGGTSISSGVVSLEGIVSFAVACTSGATVNEVDEQLAVSVSDLHYDSVAEQWVFTWKTKKEWVGSCRRLEMTLADGQAYSAVFEFRK